MIIALVVLGICLALFLFLFFFPVVKICGYSMFPTLTDGEFYLSIRVFNKSKCKVGGIYVFRPPYDSEEEKFVIKRLVEVRNGKYYFLGDNSSDSYDSRYYGFVNSENVVAKLITGREV